MDSHTQRKAKHLFDKLLNAFSPTGGTTNGMRKTNFALILDESGSMEINFPNVKICCQKMVSSMSFDNTDNTSSSEASQMMTIFTFNQTCKQIIPLTPFRSKILSTLQELSCNGGSTNTANVLQKAYDYLRTNTDPETHNVILLFTDEDIKGAKSIVKTILQEKNFSVSLAVVFMNMVTPPNLHQETGLEDYQVIAFENFNIMSQVFDLYTETSLNAHPTINQAIPTSSSVSVYINFDDPYLPVNTYILELFPLKSDKVLKRVCSSFKEVQISDLEADKDYQIRVCAEYTNGFKTKFSELYKINMLSIFSLGVKLKDEKLLKKAHSELIDQLPKASVPPRLVDFGFRTLNVIIFGLMGHGKSSFINTCCSTFAGEYTMPAIANKMPDQTVTTVYDKVKIMVEGRSKERTSVTASNYFEDIFTATGLSSSDYLNFYDIFGIRFHKDKEDPPIPEKCKFANSNYSGCLKDILNGRLRPGYKEWDAPEKMMIAKPNINEMIHSVAFLVDVAAINDTFQLKQIQEFLSVIVQLGYRPLIIFTKCDLIMKQLEGIKGRNANMKEIWDNALLQEKIKSFCASVKCIEEKDVLLFSNYQGEYDQSDRDYARELLCLNIMESLKQRGESYVSKYFKNYARVVVKNHPRPTESSSIGIIKIESEVTKLSLITNEVEKLIRNWYKKEVKDHTGFHFVYNDPITSRTVTLKNDDALEHIDLKTALINRQDEKIFFIEIHEFQKDSISIQKDSTSLSDSILTPKSSTSLNDSILIPKDSTSFQSIIPNSGYVFVLEGKSKKGKIPITEATTWGDVEQILKTQKQFAGFELVVPDIKSMPVSYFASQLENSRDLGIHVQVTNCVSRSLLMYLLEN
jgi:hypothetical protein